MEYANEE